MASIMNFQGFASAKNPPAYSFSPLSAVAGDLGQNKVGQAAAAVRSALSFSTNCSCDNKKEGDVKKIFSRSLFTHVRECKREERKKEKI